MKNIKRAAIGQMDREGAEWLGPMDVAQLVNGHLPISEAKDRKMVVRKITGKSATRAACVMA